MLLPASSSLQVIQPINNDPFIGMLETPVTSSPLVASYLSNLPAYRCAAPQGGASVPAALPRFLQCSERPSCQRKQCASVPLIRMLADVFPAAAGPRRFP
jgi:hypothetical protein